MNLRIVRERRHRAPAAQGQKRLKFDGAIDLSAPDCKKFQAVKGEDGRVLDYRDVRLQGYLSTFGNVDRDGEVVVKGAFRETIPHFMANPVLLVNHENNVKSLVGRFTRVQEDEKGLYIEAEISNSPDPDTTGVRWKVAEGILRTVSMGGVFHYATDGKRITRVDLWEGSLTPIPANPAAVISTRALTDDELARL